MSWNATTSSKMSFYVRATKITAGGKLINSSALWLMPKVPFVKFKESRGTLSMSCEETAQVGCIWLHFVIKAGQRVKHLAAIYHAVYVLHQLSRSELYRYIPSFFEHWLPSCGSPVCWLPALVLMSHTCAWLCSWCARLWPIHVVTSPWLMQLVKPQFLRAIF